MTALYIIILTLAFLFGVHVGANTRWGKPIGSILSAIVVAGAGLYGYGESVLQTILGMF